MINFKYKRLFSLVVISGAFLLLLQACKKDKVVNNNNTGLDNRIGNIITDNFNLSLFNAALNYTGLYPQLNSTQTLTVLAPDDPSFNNAGYSSAVSVRAANKAVLTQVIRYHVLAGKYDFNTLPFLFNQEVKTIDGLSMYVTRWVKGKDTVLTVNGTQIVSKNLPGSNGLIQVINAVLTPSTYPLLTQAIASNDSLTFFSQALVRANLNSTLQANGPYTVFAPTNGAFKAMGYASLDSINHTSPATLNALLKYQMLSGRKFVYDYVLSTDSTNISKQAMLDGNNLTVNVQQDPYTLKYTGITLQGIGNTSPVTLINQNILTGNGVLHVINRVLKPNF
jgi:uncharacterized surface protein with fasciclin (FAS1) repeats